MNSKILWATILCSSPAWAQPAPASTPEPGGVCLTANEKKKVVEAVQELKKIKDSPAILKFQDPIEIIGDWDGRVYVSGGATKPLRAKLTLGDTIDRDMAVTLDSRIAYRPKPPDPMFRLRFRAQVGVLIPQLINMATGDKQAFWDGGASLDFMHIDWANLSVYTGVRSAGGGVGFDLTRNFGPYIGYSLIYDGFKSSILTALYFSFN